MRRLITWLRGHPDSSIPASEVSGSVLPVAGADTQNSQVVVGTADPEPSEHGFSGLSTGAQSPVINARGSVEINYFGHPDERSTQRIPRQLPPAPVGGILFGRAAELGQLIEGLKGEGDIFVHGPAGYGKTALAAQAVRAVIGPEEALQASPFPDGIVLLDLYRFKAGDNVVWTALAQTLIGGAYSSQPPRERAVVACRNRRILIIIEGAEEADGRDGRPTLDKLLEIRDPVNRLLILTRDLNQVTPARTVRLEATLSSEAAGELFDRLLRQHIDSIVRRQVLDLLGGHPLALTWAAGLLGREDESPRELLKEWASSSLSGLSDPAKASHTLRWLFERGVRGLSTTEVTVLTAAGNLAHADIPLAAVSAALTESSGARPALRRLVQLGLLRLSDGVDQRWQFTHVLGYQFARDQGRDNDEVRVRLSHWLITYLAADNAHVSDESISHIGALLTADKHRRLGKLAGNCIHEIAQAGLQLGRPDLSRQALQFADDWISASPGDAHWERERGALLYQLGNVQLAHGDIPNALESHESSLQIRVKLADANPDDELSRYDLSMSYQGLGDVQQAQGDFRRAVDSYHRCLGIRRKLLDTDAGNVQWQRAVSISYDNLGDVHQTLGDTERAVEKYEESLELWKELARANPHDALWQHALSVSYEKLGDAYQPYTVSLAESYYSQSEMFRLKLVKTDAINTRWQRDLSVIYQKLARYHQGRGSLTSALKYHIASRDIREALAKNDPGNAQWQRDLSCSLDDFGDLHEALGNTPLALQCYTDSRSIRDLLARTDPGNIQWQRDLSTSHDKIGDAQRALGALPSALQSYAESRRLRQKLVRYGAARILLDQRTDWDPICRRSDVQSVLGRFSVVMQTDNQLQMREKLARYLDATQGDASGADEIALAILLSALTNPRRLGVPGEDLEGVQYVLLDSTEIRGETILVCGAGDSAVDTALALAGPNTVCLLNRGREFSRVSYSRHEALSDALKDPQRRLSCLFNSGVAAIGPDVSGRMRLVATIETDTGRLEMGYHRIIVKAGTVSQRSFAQWLRDLSISYDNLGDVQKALGDFPAALRSYTDGLNIRAYLNNYPNTFNILWRRDLSTGYRKLGDLHKVQGNLRVALSVYTRSLELVRQDILVKYTSTLDDAMFAISRADRAGARRLGVPGEDLEGVQYVLRDRTEIRGETILVCGTGESGIDTALALAGPNTVCLLNRGREFSRAGTYWRDAVLRALEDPQRRLSCLYNSRIVAIGPDDSGRMQLLATIEMDTVRLEIRCHRIIARIGRVPLPPFPVGWLHDLSVSHARLGDVQQAQGDLQAALLNFTDSRKIRETLVRTDPGNAWWQRDLSTALVALANLNRELALIPEALEYANASLAICQLLVERDVDNPTWRHEEMLVQELVTGLRSSLADTADSGSHPA